MVQAFVAGGARRAFGPSLHVEGDGLFVEGYWHAAFRIAPDTFIVRTEAPPEGSAVLETLKGELGGRGLREVGTDLPAITAITYTELTLGSVSWAVWAPDLPTGEERLAERVMGESFLGPDASGDADSIASGDTESMDFSTELGGARRLAGLPASFVLLVGVTPQEASEVEASLPDCRCVAMAFDEINPDDCETLLPTMIVVDARRPEGLAFISDLRGGVYAKSLPVLAVSATEGTLPGADLALDPVLGPSTWVAVIRSLLP